MFSFASRGVAKDSLFVFIALYLSALLKFSGLTNMVLNLDGGSQDLFVLAGTILVSSMFVQLIKGGGKSGFIKRAQGVLISLLIASMALLLLNEKVGIFFDHEEFILLTLFLFGLLKLAWFYAEQNWKQFPGMVGRVLIVGNGPLATQMENLVSASGGRYELSGYVDCPVDGERRFLSGNVGELSPSNDAVMSSDILAKAREARANKIVVSFSERRGVFPLQEVLSCKLSGIEVMDAPTFYERVNRKLMLENITPSWFIFSNGFKVTVLRKGFKRMVDVLGSLLGALMSLPLVPFLILAIKLDSPGPVLFKQVRVGEGDSEFDIFKFRTMCNDAESKSGAVWSQENDPRITRVGRVLRKTRLDEIPQLINVLRGDMSLVGPRPERPEFVDDLRKVIPYYSERHFVKPGVTGWAQVCYPYGSSVEDAVEKLRYDLYYIKNYSLLYDFYIMYKTVGVVLFGKGGR